MNVLIHAPSIYGDLLEKALKATDCTAIPFSHEPLFEPDGHMAFLVLPETSRNKAAQEIQKARTLLADSLPLIACTELFSRDDRALLRNAGASRLIHPESWDPQHVVKRILAEVFLDCDASLYRFHSFYGGSRAMRKIYDKIPKVAGTNYDVLIQGETGTGKENCARLVHQVSGRKGEFRPVNCAIFSKDLAASHLFGHSTGAYTGAGPARKGLLVEAGNGTLFLDEIGELDLDVQAKLLRAVETRKVLPVGGTRVQSFDARLIFATNRNLEDECREGRFKTDLLERISTLEMFLPALREHKEDIPILVRHFVEAINQKDKRSHPLPKEELDFLFRYDWPRNVRELYNVVRLGTVFADHDQAPISIESMKEKINRRSRITESKESGPSISFNPNIDQWNDVHWRAWEAYYQECLKITGGHVGNAVKKIGLRTSSVYEKNKKLEQYKENRDKKTLN